MAFRLRLQASVALFLWSGDLFPGAEVVHPASDAPALEPEVEPSAPETEPSAPETEAFAPEVRSPEQEAQATDAETPPSEQMAMCSGFESEKTVRYAAETGDDENGCAARPVTFERASCNLTRQTFVKQFIKPRPVVAREWSFSSQPLLGEQPLVVSRIARAYSLLTLRVRHRWRGL